MCMCERKRRKKKETEEGKKGGNLFLHFLHIYSRSRSKAITSNQFYRCGRPVAKNFREQCSRGWPAE